MAKIHYKEKKRDIMKKVLVTGGAGYIGSHVSRELQRAGYEPVVFDSLINGYASMADGFRFYRADLKDRRAVEEIIRKEKPLAVMHFAALNIVNDSYSSPLSYYDNNITGAINLFDAMLKNGTGFFVFSSTASVYGEPEYLPIDENHPTKPVNPYGRSKLMIEEMLKDLDQAHGLKSICLRYFNAAGADKDGATGEAHVPETHLIPLVLDAVTGKSSHISIFGQDYDTPDGTCIRDYIHITDLSRAHILALEHGIHKRESAIFNLGSEKGYSVKEIIEAVQGITGKTVNTKIEGRREGDPSKLIADSTSIKKVLGWKPEYSLEDMIRSALEWHRNKDRLLRKY